MSLLVVNSSLCLIKLKLRLLKNSFCEWGNLGKTLLTLFSAFLVGYVISLSAKEMIPSLQMMLFGEESIQWILALIVLYFTVVTFTGDMITGHSLNTGQVSSDFGYLTTLPIPPLSIIFVKLFERLITDYIGFLILFSGFIGLISRNTLNFTGISLAIVLYLQVSLLIGLVINLCILMLKRFFRVSTINNFFSILGYCSAFFTLIPYFLISNNPIRVAQWLLTNMDELTTSLGIVLKPLFWISGILLKPAFDTQFVNWTIAWLVFMIIGMAIFRLFIKLNWLTHSQSASKKITVATSRFFSGIFQKEILLIKSDYNLLVNAILMPISIIALEVYFLRGVFNLSAFNQSLNVIFGSVVYFCMFGPVNSLGVEGKAISYLESLPISPAKLLNQKIVFWVVIAEAIFFPASIIAMRFLNYTWYYSLIAAINTSIFVLACVWVSTSISAIFARYDTKILQQRSTFLGKMTALALMLVAAPVKDFSFVSLQFFVAFVFLAVLTRSLAEQKIFFRLDAETTAQKGKLLPDISVVAIFFTLHITLRHLLSYAMPIKDLGVLPWFFAAILFMPVVFIYSAQYVSKRQAGYLDYLKIKFPKFIQILNIIFLGGIFAILFALIHQFKANLFVNILPDIRDFILNFELPSNITFSIFALLAFVAVIVYELFIRGIVFQESFFNYNVRFRNIFIPLLGAIFLPWQFIPVALIYNLVSNFIFVREQNLILNVVFGATSVLGVILIMGFA